ncbi:MAG: hypothetical protein EPO52_15315 [Herbiconiux sp.]|uniref:acyl-CoA thioesterase n=1 Tax=Herbiconiux sp. TaxID=1871186 RepID=UPI001206C0AE|nr:MAG: hypothetical protein EPO52_15315 [Herbiconiux sp.]
MHQTPHIRFLRPGRFDDIVEVAVVCSHVGTSSFTLSMRLACENTILAEIKNVYVNVDSAAARSRPLPHAVATALHGEMMSSALLDVDQQSES